MEPLDHMASNPARKLPSYFIYPGYSERKLVPKTNIDNSKELLFKKTATFFNPSNSIQSRNDSPDSATFKYILSSKKHQKANPYKAYIILLTFKSFSCFFLRKPRE